MPLAPPPPPPPCYSSNLPPPPNPSKNPGYAAETKHNEIIKLLKLQQIDLKFEIQKLLAIYNFILVNDGKSFSILQVDSKKLLETLLP